MRLTLRVDSFASSPWILEANGVIPLNHFFSKSQLTLPVVKISIAL